MSALWHAAEAAAATAGTAQGDWAATGLSIDTRTLQPGDLFIALCAARDGHDFVAEALSRGACAAMVARRPEGVAADAPLLKVACVQSALEDLGRAGRARSSARVAAITGSVGKTTVKDMLRLVLADQGATHASVASYNNHWGVPLTLARMPVETEFAVIEIGMNRPGEIAPLSAVARPHVAAVTTVAAAHLEAFGALEGIAEEKSDIFTGLEADGTALVNGDLPTTPSLMAKARAHAARVRSFGEADGADARLRSVSVGDAATVMQARLGGHDLVFKLGVPGRHLAMNALLTLAVVEALGADPARAGLSLAGWQPVAGRGTRERVILDPVVGAEFALIDDAYNANPASMAAGLDVLAAAAPGPGGRRVAILGDMRELGEAGPAMHADLADLPAMRRIDVVHAVGPLMASLHAALPADRRGLRVAAADELAAQAHRLVRPGDVVLLKASAGTGLAPVVDALRQLGDTTGRSPRGGR